MTQEPFFDTVRSRLDRAVRATDPAAIASGVKDALQQALREGHLDLPARFHAARPDTYARRLLHRDEHGRYSVVVMTWGPGQRTALHDHAGIWCVECVAAGRMEVTQYDLIGEESGTYRFRQQETVEADRGSAGCLIPPFEYHVLANRQPDAASITVHVYGGDMTECHVFEPVADGGYHRSTRQLSFHD